jgi:hypothetical protein
MARDSVDGVVEGILAVFIAIVLIYALYPVLAQLNQLYAVAFVFAGILIIIATILGLLRGSGR